MTYYKFAERNVDSQINWAEVGKNMTDMLSNEVKIREEKKAALDQASRDYAQKLTDAPMGDNELLNNFTLDVADSAKQSLLMFDNLLKSGQLNPNDYLKSVQNLNTGTENLFNLSKEYNAQYAETMKRMQDGDSQLLEQDTFASLEGYAMLGNHKAYINPTDGTISLGEMIPGPNGVMQMGKPVSVSDLRNRITQKYDKYDVEKRVGEVIGSIQAQTKLIEIQNKYGISIVEEDDFFKKEGDKYVYPEAGQFLENTIKGIKAIDTNVTSILTENVVLGVNGEQFMYVQKQGDDWVEVRTGEVVKEKKENHIETSINPRSGKREFNFTEKQEEQVDNYLKEQILARAKSEQRFKRAIEPPKPSAQEIKEKAGQKKTDENVTMMSDLYYGDANQIKVAEQYFRDSIPGAVRVKKEEGSVVVTFGDGTTRKIEFGESFDDFAQSGGPLMLGNVNIKEAIERAGGKRFQEINGQQVELEPSKIIGIGSQEEAAPIEPSDVNSPINAKGDTIFDIIKTRDVRTFRIVDDAKLQKLGSEIEQAISSRATFLGKPELTAGITIKKNEDGDGLIAEKNGIVIEEVNLDVGEIEGLDEIKSFVNKIISKTLVVQQPTEEVEETPASEEPVVEEKPFG